MKMTETHKEFFKESIEKIVDKIFQGHTYDQLPADIQRRAIPIYREMLGSVLLAGLKDTLDRSLDGSIDATTLEEVARGIKTSMEIGIEAAASGQGQNEIVQHYTRDSMPVSGSGNLRDILIGGLVVWVAQGNAGEVNRARKVIFSITQVLRREEEPPRTVLENYQVVDGLTLEHELATCIIRHIL